jgi:hypothetical protein
VSSEAQEVLFISGRKGMKHYKVEIKQEAVCPILEGRLAYAAAADLLGYEMLSVTNFFDCGYFFGL